MSSDFMRLVMMVLLTYPVAVVLSTWIDDQGCDQPISVKAFGSVLEEIVTQLLSSSS